MSASMYHMPAEWEPHQATWIGWPINEDDWPGKLAAVEWVFVELARHLAPHEHLHILVPDEQTKDKALKQLTSVGTDRFTVTFHVLRTNRNWIRDAGAVFVRDPAGALKALHFQFNAWAKYDNYQLDQKIPETMASVVGIPLEKAIMEGSAGRRWMVLEGGAVDTNGSGLLLTTEQCLLDSKQQRNPGFSKSEIESALNRYLGCETVIWLKAGLAGDDTHGHVDDTARFVGPRTVAVMEEPDPRNPNHAVLKKNREILESFRDVHGPLEVVPIPMPAPLFFDGDPMPASYANFYIANNTVLVPTFNDPNDRVALGTLQDLFPNRVVRGIHAVDLVWGLGTLHCLTQQQPSR